jgi:hypothetical protein
MVQELYAKWGPEQLVAMANLPGFRTAAAIPLQKTKLVISGS